MKTKLAICALIALVAGCVSDTFTSSNGESFRRIAVGNKTAFSSFQWIETTNGAKNIQIKGYQNDQVQAIAAAAQGAVQGFMASQGAKAP